VSFKANCGAASAIGTWNHSKELAPRDGKSDISYERDQ